MRATSILFSVVALALVYPLSGGLSLYGAKLTSMISVLACVSLFLAWAYRPRFSNLLVPLLLFDVFALIRSIPTIEDPYTIQNLFAYSLFLLAISSSYSVFSESASRVRQLMLLIMISHAILGCIYTFTIIIDGPGSNLIIGSRTMGIISASALSLHASRYRFGAKIDLLPMLFHYLITLSSLSRTAFVWSSLVIFYTLLPKRPNITSFVKLLIVIVLWTSFLGISITWDPLHERFFSGDLSLQVGQIQINTMGRIAFWTVIIQSYNESPLIGKGVGSSQRILVESFGIEHPHNDYLRLLHDTGAIGLSLWIFGKLLLLNRAIRLYKLEPGGYFLRFTHLSAIISILCFLFIAFTDNVVVYPYAILVPALLIGASLARMNNEYSQRPRKQMPF